ncbi:hypothetical protein ABZT49_09200 [Methylobacterium sp. EM32]|uniref:hypothetical protein n=1 Tax=Methylobacterium sp. EM32 TaxID=3163481 RepID=UPI0033B1D581
MTRDLLERVLSALQEAEAHAQGETPPGMVVHVPDAPRPSEPADGHEEDDHGE